ncbi:MAG TPA: hypothetical protein VHF69_09260, partial [Candidatus Synoicihabitans sp.]|nr:hypothetical protein [Candidatus Synoicihabitans sp.]
MFFRSLLTLAVAALSVATSSAYNFTISKLEGVTLQPATSLQFGPDNRLYVAQVTGQILALEIQRTAPNTYQVVSTETINLVRDIPNYDDNGQRNFTLTTRQVTGLLVTGTASAPVIYVSSSDPRIGGGHDGALTNLDTNSSMISRLDRVAGTWRTRSFLRQVP